MGDIFGAPLAIEATMAFFLESVFIGVWIFGWNKISKKVHAVSIWIVAIATNLSALWILLANGWMQNPVGYVLRNSRAEMVDFVALLTNPYGWLKFVHTLISGYMVAAFFVMGVSAYHLLKKNQLAFFNRPSRSPRISVWHQPLPCAVIGDFHAVKVAQNPADQIRRHGSGLGNQRNVGFNLFVIPDTQNECNTIEGPCVPNMLSYLAFQTADAEIKGLKAFPKGGTSAGAAHVLEFPDHGRARVFHDPHGDHWRSSYLEAGNLGVPPVVPDDHAVLHSLPYIAGQLGWIVAEVGRQPWIVYGVLKTSDAVSQSISTVQVYAPLSGLPCSTADSALSISICLSKFAKKGPDNDLSAIMKPAKEEA